MTEIWRPIKGYEGLYEVSDFGRVKSLPKRRRFGNIGKQKILKGGVNGDGYPTVSLWNNGKMKTVKIHRLVAETFIPNPENKPEVNHKKGIKTDNRATKLEWATSKENIRHAYKNGLCNNDNFNKRVAQLKDGKVLKIWNSQTEASKYLKINLDCISCCCTGRTKTGGGFQWEFVD